MARPRTLLLTFSGVVVLALAGLAGYLVGTTAAPDEQQAAQVRARAADAAREQATREAFAAARERGLEAGRREGRRLAEEQQATSDADEPSAGDQPFDGSDEGDAPIGAYESFEAFCRDQPEEMECGGQGDPEELAPDDCPETGPIPLELRQRCGIE